MVYEVLLEKGAEKYLVKLSQVARIRVIKALSKIEDDPYQGKMLSGELKGLYSYRIGSLRAVYSIEGNMVVVHSLAPRGQVYK